MTRHLIALTASIALFITSCKKADVATPEESLQSAATEREAATVSAKGTVENVHWEGTYDDPPGDDDPDNAYISDMQMIHNGVAHIQNPFPVGYAYTSLNMPSGRNVPGDSLICLTSVINPPLAENKPYDVVIYFDCAQHDLAVHLVGDTAGTAQTSYSVGSQTYTTIPKLVTSFSNFVAIKVVTKKGQAAIYLNGKQAFSFKYTVANQLGRMNRITISGRGAPSIDYVKFSNSVTGKKIMAEEFNTDGQSHVVFY